MEITFEAVVDKEGLISQKETLEKFEKILGNLCANQVQEQESIKEAVHIVFDKNNGKRMPIDFAISQCLIHLNAGPDNYTDLEAKVGDYLRRHAKGEDRIFDIGIGRGRSGIARITDLIK